MLAGEDDRIDDILKNAVNVDWQKGQVAIASKNDLIWLKKRRNSDLDKIDIKKLSSDEEKNEN